MIPHRPKTALLGVGALAALTSLALAWHARDGEIPPARREEALRVEKEISRRQKENLLTGVHRGSIRGRVALDDGTTPAGIVVRARFLRHAKGATGEGAAVVRPDGSYEIRALDSKHFVLTVENAPGYVPPPPLNVDLTGETLATGADLVLRLGPLITVRVRDALTGAGIPGLLLTAENDTAGSAVGVGVPTDADGRASVRAERLDMVLRLEDREGRYGGVETPYLAKEVRLSRPEPVLWDLRVYDGRGPREATFRGVVTDPEGRPVEGASLVFYRFAEPQRATTGPDGAYAFRAKRIEWPDLQNGGGALLIAERSGLRAVRTVLPSDAWEIPKVALAPDDRATLVGRVVDERGRPIAGCPVNSGQWYPAFAGTSRSLTESARTDAAGRFRIPRLNPRASPSFTFGGPTGTYPGSPGPLGLTEIPKYANDGPGWKSVVRIAFAPLKPNETRDLGDVLVPRAPHELSGTLLGPNGEPLGKRVVVVLEGDHTGGMKQPDAQGRFRFVRVVDEPLELRVATVNAFENGWSGDPRRNSPDILLRRPVRAGETDLRLVATYRPPKPR